MDVSSEDTPLSLRQISSAENRRKRLTLFNPEEPSEKVEAQLNSTEENYEEEKRTTRGQRQYSIGESETEKREVHHSDGVRRSQRPKKLMYSSYNDSWIFAEKKAKVLHFLP